jgi:hypothetical protein
LKKYVEKDFQKFKKNLLPHVGIVKIKNKREQKSEEKGSN